MTLRCSSPSCSATLDVPDHAPVAAIRNACWDVHNGQAWCPRCAVEGR